MQEKDKEPQEEQSSFSASDAIGDGLVAFPTDLISGAANSIGTDENDMSEVVEEIPDDDGSIFGGIIDAIGNAFDKIDL